MDIKFTISNQFQNQLPITEKVYSANQFAKAAIELNKFWKQNGSKIERLLEDITGLTFNEEVISCYLNMNFSCSDPFCLKMENIERMKHNLIHEVIHVLFTQNYEYNVTFKKKWDGYWNDDYKTESRLTKSHIPVHALHYLIGVNLFPKNKIKYDSMHPDYKRSWDIVMRVGAGNIIHQRPF